MWIWKILCESGMKLHSCLNTRCIICHRCFSDPASGRWAILNPSSLIWILEGDSLCLDKILALDHDTRQSLLCQTARVAKAFQDYRLSKIGSMYGVRWSRWKSWTPVADPLRAYPEFVRGMCTWQFKMSDRSAHLNGWRGIPGLRERFPFLEEEVK